MASVKSVEKKNESLDRPQLNDFLEEIQVQAYEIYNSRIHEERLGDDLSDWLEAERIVKDKHHL